MSADQLDRVDRTLLVISESCERAVDAARDLRRDGGDEHVVEALLAAERRLVAAYNELRDEVYFPTVSSEQLRLAG